jgi:hypothetical protein
MKPVEEKGLRASKITILAEQFSEEGTANPKLDDGTRVGAPRLDTSFIVYLN